jgi:transposase
MAASAAALVAGIIDQIETRPFGTGRPPMPTIKVVEALRFFIRAGVQWRDLRATVGRASGSTLRRRLDDWHASAVLRQVHVVLVRMVRAGPAVAAWDVVVDSCSVRAKRGGELTGPNPTDRGKAGTKYHVAVSTDGIPLAVIPSAANVHDTRLFAHLLRLAQVVCAALGRLYADAGYDSADNRRLCLQDGIQPCIRKVGAPHGSGLGAVRCVVEHGCAWLLANKRLDRRQDRLGRIILVACPHAIGPLVRQGRSVGEKPCRGSDTAPRRSSSSCVRPMSCSARAGRWPRSPGRSPSTRPPTTAGGRSTAA